ncbi:hypothetical protein [Sandaracinus amylolyticus]|uniref:hypothetical protein n=1 Tax=Sandaracinus amylolyticus TaxID=927083 RepID=UPI001F222E40|nr:hypothetical protein [Sandaracinus amylolyticus]UJR81482.1 Hypothetical protein I5071_35410 [Sandaracinus amylolyticus]
MPGDASSETTTASETIAPSVFVRAVADGEWEVVDRASGERVGETHASRNAALDAALAELGDVLKGPHLRDDKTGETVGQWRWLDATSEEDEADVLDADGNVARPRITAAAIDSMAANLNASPMPRPIDGGKVPSDFAPSEVHGTYEDSGTPANGWAHAAVPFVNDKGRTHLALRAELWPTVAREVDRGRLAYGSVHVEGDDMDDTGAIEGATLESHALTNRPVVQTLLPSTAMLSRGRRAVVTLRSRGKDTMTKPKVMTLRGAALTALTELCALIGIEFSEEMDADEWSSPAVSRVRALKQLAVGEQVIEALPKGGGDPAAAVTAAYAAHRKAVSTKRAEGGTAEGGTEGATAPAASAEATQLADLLKEKVGVATDAELLAWVTENVDEIAALAEDDDAAPAGTGEGAAVTASKGGKAKGTKLALSLALNRIATLEAQVGDRVVEMVDADVAAGKVPTAERDEYLELARLNGALYSKLTKNARAVPTGRVAQSTEARLGKGPTGNAGPVAEADLDDEEKVTFEALLAMRLWDRNVCAAKARETTEERRARA